MPGRVRQRNDLWLNEMFSLHRVSSCPAWGNPRASRPKRASLFPEESLMAEIDILVGTVYGAAMLVAETLTTCRPAAMSAVSSTGN